MNLKENYSVPCLKDIIIIARPMMVESSGGGKVIGTLPGENEEEI